MVAVDIFEDRGRCFVKKEKSYGVCDRGCCVFERDDSVCDVGCCAFETDDSCEEKKSKHRGKECSFIAIRMSLPPYLQICFYLYLKYLCDTL